MSVIVRFAPSPTGHLHVGNIRAALINWLFAKREGGKFILRLDDTDRERSKEEFSQSIKKDLDWLGLSPDQTYKQSERFDLYDEAAEKLKAEGRLYACYETPEELDLKRKIQLARHKPPVYDREALGLSEDQTRAYEQEGRTPHWRFKLNLPGRIEFDDLIRGPVSIDLASVSDPILIRGDGSYLYTLPSVVDDIDMNISHVVRGEDHVTNSGVQIQIFEALGGAAPVFAHFSLLTALDGGGLSKREGALAIGQLRDEEGLEMMSLISMLAHLGTSEAIEPGTDIQSLIESFDFSKFARKSTKFDVKELYTLNAKILHMTSFVDVEDRISIEGCDEEFWNAVRPNLRKLDEVNNWWLIIHGEVEPMIEDETFARAALGLLPDGDLDGDSWQQWTGKISEQTGARGRELFMPLRLALTGKTKGPELAVLLPLIGREKVEKRLAGETA